MKKTTTLQAELVIPFYPYLIVVYLRIFKVHVRRNWVYTQRLAHDRL